MLKMVVYETFSSRSFHFFSLLTRNVDDNFVNLFTNVEHNCVKYVRRDVTDELRTKKECITILEKKGKVLSRFCMLRQQLKLQQQILRSDEKMKNTPPVHGDDIKM